MVGGVSDNTCDFETLHCRSERFPMMQILVLHASESEKTYCLVIFTSASFASQSAWGIECFAGFFFSEESVLRGGQQGG